MLDVLVVEAQGCRRDLLSSATFKNSLWLSKTTLRWTARDDDWPWRFKLFVRSKRTRRQNSNLCQEEIALETNYSVSRIRLKPDKLLGVLLKLLELQGIGLVLKLLLSRGIAPRGYFSEYLF